METRMDKLRADARFEANPPKPPLIDDPTKLFVAFASVLEGHPDDDRFVHMPLCTTRALIDLLMDDDVGDDIQYRAERRKAAETMDALAKALMFARDRLASGTEIDQAHTRAIDGELRKAGVVLTP